MRNTVVLRGIDDLRGSWRAAHRSSRSMTIECRCTVTLHGKTSHQAMYLDEAKVQADDARVSLAATDGAARGFTIGELDRSTWLAFEALVQANNGVWGGCWCMGFHIQLGKDRTPQQNRADKLERVRAGTTHAALVFDGQDCVGWCQYGTPGELPQVKSRRRYEKDLAALPDWRVTCFFTGRGHRGRGVANAALVGAVTQIARRGGGLVEGYPEETDERKVSGSFLHTGPMAAFEAAGFVRTRAISPHRWVVTLRVDAT